MMGVTITERDLKRVVDTEKDIAFYETRLPDGRTIQIVKVGHDEFKMMRGGGLRVRRVPAWSWVLTDPKTETVLEPDKQVFRTRKDALANVVAVAEHVEAGAALPQDQVFTLGQIGMGPGVAR